MGSQILLKDFTEGIWYSNDPWHCHVKSQMPRETKATDSTDSTRNHCTKLHCCANPALLHIIMPKRHRHLHPEFVYPTGSQKTTWTPHLNARVSTTSFRSSGSALLVPSTRNPLKSAKDKTARGVMNLSSPRFVSFGGRNNFHFVYGQQRLDWWLLKWCKAFINERFHARTPCISRLIGIIEHSLMAPTVPFQSFLPS